MPSVASNRLGTPETRTLEHRHPWPVQRQKTPWANTEVTPGCRERQEQKGGTATMSSASLLSSAWEGCFHEHKGKKKTNCIFYTVFQSVVLLKRRGFTQLSQKQPVFSLGFVLMSQTGRCRSCKFRWRSRPRETPSFSRLEIINVSITCLIRWLKSPTKHGSRDTNSEKEGSSEIGSCFVLFGVVLVLPFKVNLIALFLSATVLSWFNPVGSFSLQLCLVLFAYFCSS